MSLSQKQVEQVTGSGEKKTVVIQPDSPISFLQLSKLDSLVGAGDMLDLSLSAALGTGKISGTDFSSTKLSKVAQTKEVFIIISLTFHLPGDPVDWIFRPRVR